MEEIFEKIKRMEEEEEEDPEVLNFPSLHIPSPSFFACVVRGN